MLNRRSKFSALLTTIAAFLLPFSFVQELPDFAAAGSSGPTPTINRHFAAPGAILAGKGGSGPHSFSDRIKEKFAGSLIVVPTAQRCLSVCGHAIWSYLPYGVAPSEFRLVSDRSPPHVFSLTT